MNKPVSIGNKRDMTRESIWFIEIMVNFFELFIQDRPDIELKFYKKCYI